MIKLECLRLSHLNVIHLDETTRLAVRLQRVPLRHGKHCWVSPCASTSSRAYGRGLVLGPGQLSVPRVERVPWPPRGTHGRLRLALRPFPWGPAQWVFGEGKCLKGRWEVLEQV